MLAKQRISQHIRKRRFIIVVVSTIRVRPQSRSLESRTAGLQLYSWLTALSRGLKTIDG